MSNVVQETGPPEQQPTTEKMMHGDGDKDNVIKEIRGLTHALLHYYDGLQTLFVWKGPTGFVLFLLTTLLIVYSGYALLKTSSEEQKDICHRSKAYECVTTHMILLIMYIIGSTYSHRQAELKKKEKEQAAAENEDDEEEDDADNNHTGFVGPLSTKIMAEQDSQFSRSLIHYGLTVWGIFELWGVSCVDKLCNELIFTVLQLYVVLDFIVLGLFLLSTSQSLWVTFTTLD
jgi:hypothetical protein